MGDDRLRELEQRWRATGAVDDEARWHAARLRAGLVDPALLPVAAWAGSEAARLLAGAGPAPPPVLDPAREWPALSGWLGDGLTHAPLAARRRSAQAELERLLLVLDGAAEEGARRDRDWGLAARALLRAVADDLATTLLRGEPAGNVPSRAGELDGVGPPPPAVSRERALAWRVAKRVCRFVCEPARPTAWWTAYRSPPAEASGWPAAIRTTQREALLGWALGLGDPLRERAERALEALEVASPCDEPWSRMRPLDADGTVRQCDRCQRSVHDLSGLTAAEAGQLLLGGPEAPCVRFYRRTDGTVVTRDCAPRRLPGWNRREQGRGIDPGREVWGRYPRLGRVTPAPPGPPGGPR